MQAQERSSLRGLTRTFGVSRTTVSSWIKKKEFSFLQKAFEALKVVRATQSLSNETRVQNLYQQLQRSYPHHPLVNRLGMQLTQR